MSVTRNFERPSLKSFESRNSYSFEGYSLNAGFADALCSDGQQASPAQSLTEQRFTVEDFFEECHDAGADVPSESNFEKGAFIGSGATMQVYEGLWKSPNQKVALK